MQDDPLVPVLKEHGERHLALDQHPTAEYIAKYIYDAVTQQGLHVTEVKLWETPSSVACFKKH